MDWITDPQAWAGFLTLTVLEIVLGIDNIIFISILAGKLPQAQQGKARKVGLLLAMLTRILLLLSLAFLARLTSPSSPSGPRDLRPRPGPAGGRLVPALQEHPGDPRAPGRP